MTQTRTPNITDYEAERRNFLLEVPEYFNFAIDVIGKWASAPNKLQCTGLGNMEKRSTSPLLISLNGPVAQLTLSPLANNREGWDYNF
jgi:hypothetical protein